MGSSQVLTAGEHFQAAQVALHSDKFKEAIRHFRRAAELEYEV
jgi:hypothetical protein